MPSDKRSIVADSKPCRNVDRLAIEVTQETDSRQPPRRNSGAGSIEAYWTHAVGLGLELADELAGAVTRPAARRGSRGVVDVSYRTSCDLEPGCQSGSSLLISARRARRTIKCPTRAGRLSARSRHRRPGSWAGARLRRNSVRKVVFGDLKGCSHCAASSPMIGRPRPDQSAAARGASC